MAKVKITKRDSNGRIVKSRRVRTADGVKTRKPVRKRSRPRGLLGKRKR